MRSMFLDVRPGSHDQVFCTFVCISSFGAITSRLYLLVQLLAKRKRLGFSLKKLAKLSHVVFPLESVYASGSQSGVRGPFRVREALSEGPQKKFGVGLTWLMA